MYSVICIKTFKTAVFNSKKLDMISEVKNGYF